MSARLSASSLAAISPEDIRKGIPAARIDALADLGIDRGRVLRLIGAPSTLRRRIKDKARLTPEESDRLARLTRVVGHAIDVFGSRDKAVHWMMRSIRYRADGATPLELLDTDPGAEWVDERLMQIAHGMFA